MILGQLKIGEHQAKCRALVMDALLLNHVMQGASSLIYHALGKSVYSSALFQGVGFTSWGQKTSSLWWIQPSLKTEPTAQFAGDLAQFFFGGVRRFFPFILVFINTYKFVFSYELLVKEVNTFDKTVFSSSVITKKASGPSGIPGLRLTRDKRKLVVDTTAACRYHRGEVSRQKRPGCDRRLQSGGAQIIRLCNPTSQSDSWPRYSFVTNWTGLDQNWRIGWMDQTP